MGRRWKAAGAFDYLDAVPYGVNILWPLVNKLAC